MTFTAASIAARQSSAEAEAETETTALEFGLRTLKVLPDEAGTAWPSMNNGTKAIDLPLPATCESMAPKPHVSYVLLAEFDIDVGPTLSRQLPWPTGVDQQ